VNLGVLIGWISVMTSIFSASLTLSNCYFALVEEWTMELASRWQVLQYAPNMPHGIDAVVDVDGFSVL